MKIVKREDFALIFMRELALSRSGKYVSLASIAKKVNLSPLFLKHIATSLLEKKLVESKEGIAGGYKLRRSPADITIADIVGAISSGVAVPSCLHGGKCRLKNLRCVCIKLWDDVNSEINKYLKNISLSDFAKT